MDAPSSQFQKAHCGKSRSASRRERAEAKKRRRNLKAALWFLYYWMPDDARIRFRIVVLDENTRVVMIWIGENVNKPDLLKAIRTGQLSMVIAALNAGAPLELDDGKGAPGLPLAIASLHGHAEIVRELAIRGAVVNSGDNSSSNSPLSMAVRAGKKEVVKVLIECGAIVPEGMKTGLRKDELMLAKWKAQHLGASVDVGEIQNEPEEIRVGGCYGTDTDILNAEMRRAVEALSPKT
jgi:hypothetical protein